MSWPAHATLQAAGLEAPPRPADEASARDGGVNTQPRASLPDARRALAPARHAEPRCLLGSHCSYGEWANPSLAPAAVALTAGCYGEAPCAGVAAWQVLQPRAVAPPAGATAALAFNITAAVALNITELRGEAPAGTVASVWGCTGAACEPGASAGWAQLWAGSWSGAAVPLWLPLALAAGATGALLVLTAPAAALLPCAHALGAPGAPLLADASLAVAQAGALAGAFAGQQPAAACAWAGLQLSYTAAAACAPPPPPPLPAIATSVPIALVGSLADLLAALADPAVTQIEVNAHIALNGAELTIAPPLSGTRVLLLEGTNSCRRGNAATPQCRLDARGASRVLRVPERVRLTIADLQLANGATAATGDIGGCLVAECADCSLDLDGVEIRNCTALYGGGGGVAVLGGGALRVRGGAFRGCRAGMGAGLLYSGGSVALNGTLFSGNSASASSQDTEEMRGGVYGPGGGGAALFNATATISGCAYDSNHATTTDVWQLPNEAFPQARAGGLLAAHSTLLMTASTFTSNSAFYGGGLYVYDTAATLEHCALARNIATLGDGGGMFASDCASLTLSDTLFTGNSAGGRLGGGVAVAGSPTTLARCILTANAAPAGCGGGLALGAGASAQVGDGTALRNNSARDGGGVCADLGLQLQITDAFMHDNLASRTGGAVYTSGTPTQLANTSLMGNAAPQGGGAVAAFAAPLNLTDCVLRLNSVASLHGGAVLHDATDDPSAALVLTRCAMERNSCGAGGGALAVFAAASAMLTACDLSQNSVAASAPAGGAILALDVGSMLLVDCNLTLNRIEVVDMAAAASARLEFAAAVTLPGAGHAGALWLGSNSAATAVVRRCRFSENTAPAAGAVYATGTVQLRILATAFDRNVADTIGGALVTSAAAVATIDASSFSGCAAQRGGAAWHDGASAAAYTACTFTANEAVAAVVSEGAAVFVTDAADVSISASLFAHNLAAGEGTVVLAGTNASHLRISDSGFDNNTATLGGCLFVVRSLPACGRCVTYSAALTRLRLAASRQSVDAQALQLHLSNVSFTNSRAFAGAVLFTEAVSFEPLLCEPLPCDADSSNTCDDYGPVQATPTSYFSVSAPASVRSGSLLPVVMRLQDGFHQTMLEWPETMASVTSTARLAGIARMVYQGGVADFATLTLHGNESQVYELAFTLSGPNLFGHGRTTESVTRAVTVAACEQTETFDAAALMCMCAAGFGLVTQNNTCVRCAANEVVPADSALCVACPLFSTPEGPASCRCIAGYSGTLVGACSACSRPRCAAC